MFTKTRFTDWDLKDAIQEGLQKAGFQDVFAHVQKGTAHGIASDGLSVALAFMRDKLGL